jgi:hypothetical protein
MRTRLAAMKAISAAEKNIVATRHTPATQISVMPPPRRPEASAA